MNITHNPAHISVLKRLMIHRCTPIRMLGWIRHAFIPREYLLMRINLPFHECHWLKQFVLKTLTNGFVILSAKWLTFLMLIERKYLTFLNKNQWRLVAFEINIRLIFNFAHSNKTKTISQKTTLRLLPKTV